MNREQINILIFIYQRYCYIQCYSYSHNKINNKIKQTEKLMKNKNAKKQIKLKTDPQSPYKQQQYTHSTLITDPNIEPFHNQFIEHQQNNKSQLNLVSKQAQQKNLLNINVHKVDPAFQVHKNTSLYSKVNQINQFVASEISQGITVVQNHRQQVDDLFLQYLPKQQVQNILKRKQQKKMKELIKMKQEALQKLDKVYEQQAKIRLNRKNKIYSALSNYTRFATEASSNKINKGSNQKKSRSYFSPQQKHKIKQILKSKQQKPIMNERKVQQLLNSLQIEKQQRIIEQKLKIQKLKQQHRKQVEQHLKRKQFEKKQKELVKQKYQSHKVKLQNYAHLKYQKTDLMRQKQKIKIEQIILLKQKDQKRLDFEQIKQHQKKYLQIMKEKKAQLEEKTKSRIFAFQPQRKVYQITKIHQVLKEQDHSQFQKLQKFQLLRIQYHRKLKEYDNYIKANHQPKSNQKSKFEPKRRISVSVLSQQQRARQGNRYLEYAKLLKKNSQLQHSMTEKDRQSNFSIGKLTEYQQKKATRQKYPNYLQFVKELNQANNNRNNEQQQQKQLMRILKNENSSLIQIKKAVKLANKLTKTVKQNPNIKANSRIKTQSDYQNARTKLLLLNGIMNVEKQQK